MDIDGDDDPSARALAIALVKRGDFEYARSLLSSFAERHDDPEIRQLLARADEGSGVLPQAALRQAIEQRRPPPGLVHHSDRGLQYRGPRRQVFVAGVGYALEEHARVLRLHGIVPSMSRPANPHDNAFYESFMRTLKREEIDARSYRDLEDLRAHVAEFIEQYYNRCRLHSALGYRPPEEFEQEAALTEHNLAGGISAASMSFSRHGEIYRWDGETAPTASPAHPKNRKQQTASATIRNCLNLGGHPTAWCGECIQDKASYPIWQVF